MDRVSHKIGVTVAFMISAWVAGSSRSFAQSPSCTAPPTAPANAAASVTAGGNAATPALVKVQWVAAAPGPNAATSYVVEVGDAPGVTNISQFDTGETALSTIQPAANGTYYVRVRSVNACGKSAPSPEPLVTVTDSVAFGEAAARRISGFFTDDGEGYALVLGEVRGAWGARPTPFIRIDSYFQDSAGQEIGSAFGYAYGRARRLASSRLIDDATLGSGETGCFIIFTDVPYSNVTSASTTTSWDDFALEPLQGSVVVQSVQSGTTTLGDVRVQGQVRNNGSVSTYFNQVMIALRNTDNDIIDCDFTFVKGSRMQLPSGVVTDSALAPNQVGDYLNIHSLDAKSLGRTVTWPAWEEADTAQKAAAITVMRWRDVVGSTLEDMAIGSHARRARTRADAINQVRRLSLTQTPQVAGARLSTGVKARAVEEVPKKSANRR